MITPNRARAKLACEIARVDPARFNEAVFAGNYPCAPETAPGAARIFDIEDMVALCVYGDLLEQEVPPRRAGGIACRIRTFLGEHPGAGRVLEVRMEMGARHYAQAEGFDYTATHMNGLHIMEVREFRLAPLRARVISALNDAAGIVGGEA